MVHLGQSIHIHVGRRGAAEAEGTFTAWPHCLHLMVLPAHCSDVVYNRLQWLH